MFKNVFSQTSIRESVLDQKKSRSGISDRFINLNLYDLNRQQVQYTKKTNNSILLLKYRPKRSREIS